MRQRTIFVAFLLVLVFLLTNGMTCGLTVKEDITDEEIAQIAISSVQDETLDLLVQCRQYAAVDDEFKLLFDETLLPKFNTINGYIKTATQYMVAGSYEKIDLDDARTMLRTIALELAKAKGE